MLLVAVNGSVGILCAGTQIFSLNFGKESFKFWIIERNKSSLNGGFADNTERSNLQEAAVTESRIQVSAIFFVLCNVYSG